MPDALKTLCAADLSDSLREISNAFKVHLFYLSILGDFCHGLTHFLQLLLVFPCVYNLKIIQYNYM